MNTALDPRSDYRADIDGLRAIAVLAVVGFHADIGALHGGFIGVDVFFVISGYLICGIVFRALGRGKFNFADFYVRRINRILPALLIVLAATAAVGWTILFSREFALLGKHIFGGATFLSNVILWREAGYFDSPLKPLRHLWSLSVEEQFYLAWPLLAFLTWRWNKRSMPSMLLAIVVTSFLLNVVAFRFSSGSTAFYSPFTRFWQILSGGLLAYVESQRTWPRLNSLRLASATKLAASALGLSLIVLALALVRSSTPWPGWYALLPVCGTLLLIGGGPNTWINTRLLADKRLVAIGLISYPIYLWHWPLLVFGNLVNDGAVPPVATAGIVVLTLILAQATYIWIEKPIRFGKHKRRSAGILLAALAATGLFGLLGQQRIIRPRLGQTASAIAEAQGDWEYPGSGGLARLSGDMVVDTIQGDSSRTVAFLGDSHIQQYWPRVVEIARRTGHTFPRVLFLTYGSCPPLPNINRNMVDPLTGSPFECHRFHEKAMRLLASPAVSKVVIGAYWELYFIEGKTFSTTDSGRTPLTLYGAQTDIAFQELELELERLTKAGKRVYILLSNPTSPAFDPRSMFPNRLRGIKEKKPIRSISKAEFMSREKAITQRLRTLALRTGATVIDPVEYLCGIATCMTVAPNGLPIYIDEQHLRSSFARQSATFIDLIFGN